MMESRSSATLIALVVAVVALLAGLCLGLFAGGTAGYVLGQRAASARRPAATLQVPRQLPGPNQAPFATPANPLAAGGVLVREVIDGSPAANAGIQVGDIITRVNQMPLDANHSLNDLLGQYKPGDRVGLTLVRRNNTRTVQVTLAASANDASRAYLGIRYADLGPGTGPGAPQP